MSKLTREQVIMSLAQANKWSTLRLRAEQLQKARAFFSKRGVIEVDCPALIRAPNIDDHIDPLKLSFRNNQVGYLHTSPELFLKKLLARGAEDIYYLGHVFRDHESGDHHSVEFTMVEWYRKHLGYQELISETLDFIGLFLPNEEVQFMTYEEALKKEVPLDYEKVTREELIQFIHTHIDPSLSFTHESQSDLVIFIFAALVEPKLSEKGLVVLTHFPKDQAALAKIHMVQGKEMAGRFEIYYKGVELANGYDELRGSHELLERMQGYNEKRVLFEKEELPIDQEFVELNANLPDCRGVSVGFDRLMMLQLQAKNIQEGMAFL